MKVYVVYIECGEYSDYSMGIEGVFSTAEKAKEAVDQHYTPVTEWVMEEDTWHRYTEKESFWDNLSITVASYELDVDIQSQRR